MTAIFVTDGEGNRVDFSDFDAGVRLVVRHIDSVFGPRSFEIKTYLLFRLQGAINGYRRGEHKASVGSVTNVMFFLADMAVVRLHQPKTFRALRSMLRNAGNRAEFPGMRQEVRRAAFFCQQSVNFEKRESPDFSVRLGDGQRVGVECTSCTLRNPLRDGKSDVLYKVKAAISKKSERAATYDDLPLILEIDISSLMYRVGSVGASTVLGGTETHAAVRPSVDASVFECVLLSAYIMREVDTTHGIQLNPQNMFWRVDRSAPLSHACEEYLATYFSNDSTNTVHGRIFELV